VNPTKAEVDYWHSVVINHVRALVNYTEPEYIMTPDKCLHIRALWADERRFTSKWDTKYPNGTCVGSSNPHCGASFIPSVEDQQEYLPDEIASCARRAGSEGIFGNGASVPWSIRWARPFCTTLAQEGFWGGHTGPWFHRSQFGFNWVDSSDDPEVYNSWASLRAKWSGSPGKLKYEDPRITNKIWLVNVEGVDPEPRFETMECKGRVWRAKGSPNATDCYNRMMADPNAGKLFMTITTNGGCTYYPHNVTTCTIVPVYGRKTWDFTPRVFSYKGFLIDPIKQVSGNALPYSGRRCPNIIWDGMPGAGDVADCLRQIVEFPKCGTKFVTITTGGGCACYPPSQVTCTRAESVGESGRLTYEIEVDPNYVTNSPTSSPITSIPTVTISPSTSPSTTFSPSDTISAMPSNSPVTLSPTDGPDDSIEMWRIWADNSMLIKEGDFGVSDLRFYSKPNCTGINYNRGTAISSYSGNLFPDTNAFDSDNETLWRSLVDGPNPYPVAWIGMAFGGPVPVRCVSFKDREDIAALAVEVQVLSARYNTRPSWSTLVRVGIIKHGRRHNITLPEITSTPSGIPSVAPSSSPMTALSATPSADPSTKPTFAPTATPTARPTDAPTAAPTSTPTTAPTSTPTAVPTATSTATPTDEPTAAPTSRPTATPTAKPTAAPTATPTTTSSAAPTSSPTDCTDDMLAEFLLKQKTNKKGIIVNVPRSCDWLKKKSPEIQRKKCKVLVQCDSQLGTPQDVCPETCGFCGMCEENKRARFFLKLDQEDEVVTRSCGWLKKRNNRKALCAKTVISSCHGLASDVCPTTCFEQTGCPNSMA